MQFFFCRQCCSNIPFEHCSIWRILQQYSPSIFIVTKTMDGSNDYHVVAKDFQDNFNLKSFISLYMDQNNPVKEQGARVLKLWYSMLKTGKHFGRCFMQLMYVYILYKLCTLWVYTGKQLMQSCMAYALSQ